MRAGVYLVALLVFGAMLIIDPVALVRLGHACATGKCGVSSRHVALGTAGLVLLWFVTTLISRLRRVPPPLPKARRKPRKKA